MKAITLEHISLTRGNKQLFADFSLSFEAEKVTAIIAPSGAGKTSLFDIIAGRLPLDNGTIQCDNDNERISYVFQEDRLLPWHTVERNILLPLEHLCRNKANAPTLLCADEAQERTAKYIQLCGINDKTHAKPPQLSGGEKQRVSIARAFAYPSDILLMDEAFQSLDLHIKLQLMQLFRNLIAEEKRTVLLVTHDIREALCLADRILVLTGSPLAIRLDTTAPKGKNTPIAEEYIHLSSEKAAIEEKILSLLS